MPKTTTGPSTPFAALRSLRMTSFWVDLLEDEFFGCGLLKKTEADLGSASILYLSGWDYVRAEARNFKPVRHPSH